VQFANGGIIIRIKIKSRWSGRLNSKNSAVGAESKRFTRRGESPENKENVRPPLAGGYF